MIGNFADRLWLAIAVFEVLLVTVRLFLPHGPLRLTLALMIPCLILLGAVVNAVYNRVTTGRTVGDRLSGKRG